MAEKILPYPSPRILFQRTSIMRIDLNTVVRASGKPHRAIAAAANCTEATLNRILNGRVRTCKLDTLEAIAAALGYEVRLVKKVE
jgi:DNA-binding Xre family transcriptional regulator